MSFSSILLLLVALVLMGVSSGTRKSAQNQTRITGGTQSAQGKWPFFAGMFYDGTFLPQCGGVVWEKHTILTAAHCILSLTHPSLEPKYFEFYLGHNEFIFQKNQVYMFKAKEIIIHPEYYMEGYSNDIALIRLERSIDFDGVNKMVECVCDPEPFSLLDTSACIAMGWGLDSYNMTPSTLMEVVLPIQGDNICKSNVNFDPTSHLCAGSVGKATCTGDSGGPLVCSQKADRNKYSLVGLFNYAVLPCGKHPSYFCRVEYYLEWIAEERASR